MTLSPTVAGCAAGIIARDEHGFTQQCGDCGRVNVVRPLVSGDRSLWLGLRASGAGFHLCEGQPWRRRCPDCLADTLAACPDADHHDQLARAAAHSGDGWTHPRKETP